MIWGFFPVDMASVCSPSLRAIFAHCCQPRDTPRRVKSNIIIPWVNIVERSHLHWLQRKWGTRRYFWCALVNLNSGPITAEQTAEKQPAATSPCCKHLSILYLILGFVLCPKTTLKQNKSNKPDTGFVLHMTSGQNYSSSLPQIILGVILQNCCQLIMPI